MIYIIFLLLLCCGAPSERRTPDVVQPSERSGERPVTQEGHSDESVKALLRPKATKGYKTQHSYKSQKASGK